MEEKTKDDSEIIARAIKEMEEAGTLYKADGKPNIPLLMEKTGLTRQRARSLAKKDFKNVPHGNTGKEREKALNAEESAVVNSLLSKGETNSTVLMRELKDRFGFTGSISSVKRYKYAHQYLVPSPRITVSLQGRRINRYETGPGFMFQMDWGFVNVNCIDGSVVRVAVFAMVCHHCGKIFVEFFPNSRQHNLFIGMIHCFIYMGMPEVVLTDNMASVSNRRDASGKPIMNATYDAFQKACGFTTRLCKPRHPFTKGKVERLVEFVKSSFTPAREFINITDLNEQAVRWCDDWNSRFHKSTGFTPDYEHATEPLTYVEYNQGLKEVFWEYMAPLRRISMDGFINYDGRRYGVPFSYTKKKVRVMRDKDLLTIMDESCSYVVVKHNVDWSYSPHYCDGQFSEEEPEELPTAKVTAYISQIKADGNTYPSLLRFDFADKDKGEV